MRNQVFIRNKKGQGGPVAMVFLVLVFLLNWAVWLGPWLIEAGQITIQAGGLTGSEAFFWANLNLWVGLSLILGTMGFFYFGGGQ